MPDREKAIAFDLSPDSLTSLRAALPGWEIEVIDCATASTLSSDWDPGAADLLVVNASGNVSEALGLCRFLTFCSGYSADSRGETGEDSVPRGGSRGAGQRADAPLLVLVRPGQESLVRAALAAGASHCLVLPIHPQEVVNMLAHARAGNRPGRHTLNLEPGQREDDWRDVGGEG
jgi:hypothetical protein